MSNQLKSGVYLTYILMLLNNIIGLVYTPYLLRMLGQSEFGLYSLISSIVAYLAVLDFGFGNAIIRYTAQFITEGKIAKQYSLFGMFLILYIGIGIFSLLLGVCFYQNIDVFFSDTMSVIELERSKTMIVLLIVNLSLSFPLSVFTSITVAYEKFVFVKTIQILRTVIQPLIMCLVLFWGYKAIAMIVVITFLNISTLLFNTWYCFYKLKIKINFYNCDWDLFKEIGKYSYFIFIGVLVEQIYWNSGQLILGATVGVSSVAIFSVAMQFRAYYTNFSTSISNVFLPRITSIITFDKNDMEISNLFIRVGRIQYEIIVFVLTGFILFGKSFIKLWAGTEYVNSYYIALILMIPLTVVLIQNMGVLILQAKKQLKFRTYLYFIIALLGLIFSIPLAKIYGGLGCALSISLSLFLGEVIIMNIYYYKYVNIDIPRFWAEIFKLSKLVFLVFLIGALMDFIIDYDSVIILIVKIVLYTILFVLFLWKWGMNEYEQSIVRTTFVKIVDLIR